MPVDPDFYRQQQMHNAYVAYNKGYKKAIRHTNSMACWGCSKANGEVLDILDVVNGYADHRNGHCNWTYTT